MKREPSLIVTGVLGRCPACGQGRLFSGFLDVVPNCECCGMAFGGQDSGDGPFAFIILIAGGLVVGSALVVEAKYAWPLWLHMVVWLPLATVLCVGLLRPFKGLLIALQYRHRRTDFHADG